MLSIANQKGANQKLIRCHFHGGVNQQKTTLKNEFLSSTEKYTTHVANFYTNASPSIFFADDLYAVLIRPRGDLQAFPRNYPANSVLGTFGEFQVGPSFRDGSVLAFVGRLRRFISNFNFNLNIFGADFAHHGQNDIPAIQQNVNDPYTLHDFTNVNQIVDHIRVGIADNGPLKFEFTRLFAENFYLEFSASMRSILGLPRFIWVGGDGAGGVVTSNNNTMAILNPVQTHFVTFPAIPVGFDNNLFFSSKTVFSADQRVTLDIESTLPTYNTISSEFSKEIHTRLLARFNLSDFININAYTKSNNGLVISGIEFEEQVTDGVKDLVRNPHTNLSMLRPSTIQAVDISLWLRYIVDKKIVKTEFKLLDHEWVDFTLSFIKRV